MKNILLVASIAYGLGLGVLSQLAPAALSTFALVGAMALGAGWMIHGMRKKRGG